MISRTSHLTEDILWRTCSVERDNNCCVCSVVLFPGPEVAISLLYWGYSTGRDLFLAVDYFVHILQILYTSLLTTWLEQSISLNKGRPRHYAKSVPVQDVFQPTPGLIGCTGGEWEMGSCIEYSQVGFSIQQLYSTGRSVIINITLWEPIKLEFLPDHMVGLW